MPKLPGLCIFCGRGGLSKEHIFPDWMRQLFRRTPTDTHTEGEIWWVPNPRSNNEMWTLPARRLVQGHAGSRKVRVVCRSCNNGWIGDIDEAAKPTLLPLICDRPTIINRDQQQILGKFLTKVVITSEYTKPRDRAIPKEQRDYFFLNRNPLPLWHIWIGRYNGSLWRELMIFHHMVKLLAHTEKPSGGPRNTHSTVMGMGSLLALVIGTSRNNLTFEIGDSHESALVRLWPIRNDIIRWPPPDVIGDVGADVIANTLSRIAGLPNALPRMLQP
jgi:hypothetical protein